MSESKTKITEIVNELSAFISALPSAKSALDTRYVDEYHEFIDLLQPLVDRDLGRYRIADEDLKSATDRFKEMDPSISLGRLPAGFDKPTVDTEILRITGSRLVSLFRHQNHDTSVIQQHITISGTGNQTVVGVAGGDLDQDAKQEVRPGDEAALLSGLKSIGIDQTAIDQLSQSLSEHTDPDGKKYAVRSWIKSFTSDVLSGAIGGSIASQAPAALAMALSYLS